MFVMYNTNQYTTRSKKQAKKATKRAYFHKGPPQRYKKKQAGKLERKLRNNGISLFHC